jgi:hypothetical protein
MKLTKLHIFLILLLALVLCSTLGMCSTQVIEGLSSRSDDKRTYESYSDYNTQKNDDNIRSVNHSDNKSSNYNNPFYNKANWNKDKSNDNHDEDHDHDHDHDDDDDDDRSNTRKHKYSDYRDSSDRKSKNRIIDRIGIFDSVAKGNVNGSTYNIKETITKEDEGISRSRIPPGQENLYILKSEIVPPICPACPTVNCNNDNNNSESKKCQPCPPCARCPEPSFECKKVPNYNSVNLMNQLPVPWASKL